MSYLMTTSDLLAMKIALVLLNSLILAIINLSSILMGFIVYHFFNQFNQSLVQIPVAFLCSLVAFIIWVIIVRYKLPELVPRGILSYLSIFILSLVWVPIIFYPLHYFTQHYPSSFRNIAWVWFFQTPTNVITIFVSYILFKNKK